jgi:hypothetical protein
MGGNVESFRIAEALETGSVPIVQSALDLEVIYPMHPMPYVRDFSRNPSDLVEAIEEVRGEEQGVAGVQERLLEYWRHLKADINHKFLSAMSRRASEAATAATAATSPRSQ